MKYLIVLLLACSCSPNGLLKRADRLTKRAIEKGAIVNNDTVYTDRTVYFPEYRTDTLYMAVNFTDTLRLETERIKWKVKVNDVLKTVYVDVACKADTVIIRVPVEVIKTIKPNRNTFQIVIGSMIIAWIILIAGYIIAKKHKYPF